MCSREYHYFHGVHLKGEEEYEYVGVCLMLCIFSAAGLLFVLLCSSLGRRLSSMGSPILRYAVFGLHVKFLCRV